MIVKSDCAKMLFNPLEVITMVLHHYPRLKKYPEFNVDINRRDDIIRYIALMYDRNSPLVEERQVMKRKLTALTLINVNPQEKFGLMLIGDINAQVNAMIVQYCRMQHDFAYSRFIMMEQALYSEYLAIQNERDSLSRQRMIGNIAKLESQLKDVTLQIFEGDDSVRLEKQLLNMIEAEIDLRLRPEDMAVKYIDDDN